MPSLKLIFFAILLVGTSARAADVRVALLGGLGISSVTSKGSTQTEGPYALNFSVDTVFNPRLTIGLEHARSVSLTPASSAVSTSGVFFRSYLFSLAPTSSPLPTGDVSFMYQRALGFFVGGGMGFGQSSLLPDVDQTEPTNSVVVYLKARGGFDLPLSRTWGAQFESSISTTLAGAGAISTVNLLGGVYYFF